MAQLHFHEEPGDTLESMIADLQGLQGPPHRATAKFEALLEAAFIDTQARTHVISGSLKASGKTQSSFEGDVWKGEIQYGGQLWRVASPGPSKDPVDYAIYEQARGGEHDFMSGLPGFENTFEQILSDIFPDGL